MISQQEKSWQQFNPEWKIASKQNVHYFTFYKFLLLYITYFITVEVHNYILGKCDKIPKDTVFNTVNGNFSDL